ncbi:uncharacterized protein V1510DRAFT_244950 [Dipodascopsis tothii]|uniref:uncharacterized protein n=1 Tax=Dipodascopsis tothii TaxID=44089 RepID=UPI0034CD3FD9
MSSPFGTPRTSSPSRSPYGMSAAKIPSTFPASPAPARSTAVPGTPAPAGGARPRVAGSGLPPPLISEQYLDVGSQRMYAISLFVLLQVWKITDLIAIRRGTSSTDAELAFVFKFLILDGLFLFILPLFRIPWLTFSGPITLVQIVLMAVWTLFLSSASTVPLSAFFGAAVKSVYDRELSISEHRVRAKDYMQPASHISGRHVVHILPESTARLNPSGEVYCFGPDTTTLYLPVRLNATEPKLIQLYHVEFEDSAVQVLNYTKRELRKLTEVVPSTDSAKPSRISNVRLPVKRPGLYRLARVVDTSNLDARLFQVDVLLSRCPQAVITPPRNINGLDRCIGALDSPSLEVVGVPPLRVKYSRSVRGIDAVFSVQSIQPDHFKSPLVQGRPNTMGRVWKGESLDWAVPQTVEIGLDTSLGTVGKWSYVIDEVEDGLGNMLNYSQIHADKDREESPALATMGLNYGFLVHPRPTIHFTTCNPERPVNLPQGRTVAAPVHIAGSPEEGPYKVKILRTPLENSIDGSGVPETPEILELTMHGGNDRFNIRKPGHYAIESIRGGFCTGDILESSACIALMPAEPTLSVQFEDIEDKCAGSIGVTADLTLTGTPPFEVRYQTVKDRTSVKTERLVVTKTRHQLQFRPDSAGHYSYEFFSLEDSLYKGIQLNRTLYRTEQTVRVLASASFDRSSLSKRCCTGDSTEFDVNFHGQPPFTLNYEILHGNKRKQHSVSGIETTRYKLRTPELTSGGSYIVALLSVEDANECKTALSEADARVEVRRQRPAASFMPIDGKMKTSALQGKRVNIPLRLAGEGPWRVTYGYTDTDGKTSKHTVSKSRANGDFISVDGNGVYELLDVTDAYCPGTVTRNSHEFELNWFETPSIELVDSPSLNRRGGGPIVRKDICEGDEDTLEIALTGAPPFSLLYDKEFVLADGSSRPVAQDLQAVTKYANVHMETSRAGTYRYRFKAVSDSIYNQQEIAKYPFKPIVVEQVVHARPDAAFADSGKLYKSCVNADADDKSTQPINIKLSGYPPYALTLNIKHENTGNADSITISNIKDSLYPLRSIYSSLGLGRHVVTLGKVLDGRGCSRETFRASQQVVVSVSDIPVIVPVSPQTHYCVGDRIAFGLTGVPPFEIEYEFNGRRQRASTGSPFSRLASSPGNFTVVSVADSASSCKVSVQDDLTKIIHDVPTIRVSEGTPVVQDIHEGDRAEIVFKFTGTPPFSFTYTRSERVGRSRKQRVLETHSVSDVHDYTYSIYTSMEGSYEAMSIEDRYCKAHIA